MFPSKPDYLLVMLCIISFTCPSLYVRRLLEEIYEDLGDTLAVQYGGSQLVHRLVFNPFTSLPRLRLLVGFCRCLGYRHIGRLLPWRRTVETSTRPFRDTTAMPSLVHTHLSTCLIQWNPSHYMGNLLELLSSFP